LRRRSFEKSWPFVVIGVEEPMFVCGAIASTVSGLADNRSGRVRARSARRDVDDHGHPRGQQRLHDLAQSRSPARPGGVELDHDSAYPSRSHPAHLILEELLRDGG